MRKIDRLSISAHWKGVCFIAVVVLVATLLTIRDLSPRRIPEPLGPPEAVRLQGMQGDGAGVLEVPLVKYQRLDGEGRGSGVTLDFIGAVHMGDEEYYRDLNRRFKEYDGVLFELVADPNRIRRVNKESASSGLGWVQKQLSEVMGLSFQLEIIDYRAPNFIHADLSPEQLEAAMVARGETPWSLLKRILLVSADPKLRRRLKEFGGSSAEIEAINPVLTLLRGPTQRERLLLKRFMARSLLGSESFIDVLGGGKEFSLIHDRNQAVVEVVRREVKRGKRRLAIFYGTGHLSDLHSRLERDLGFKIVSVEWLPAWKIPAVEGRRSPNDGAP